MQYGAVRHGAARWLTKLELACWICRSRLLWCQYSNAGCLGPHSTRQRWHAACTASWMRTASSSWPCACRTAQCGPSPRVSTRPTCWTSPGAPSELERSKRGARRAQGRPHLEVHQGAGHAAIHSHIHHRGLHPLTGAWVTVKHLHPLLLQQHATLCVCHRPAHRQRQEQRGAPMRSTHAHARVPTRARRGDMSEIHSSNVLLQCS